MLKDTPKQIPCSQIQSIQVFPVRHGYGTFFGDITKCLERYITKSYTKTTNTQSAPTRSTSIFGASAMSPPNPAAAVAAAAQQFTMVHNKATTRIGSFIGSSAAMFLLVLITAHCTNIASAHRSATSSISLLSPSSTSSQSSHYDAKLLFDASQASTTLVLPHDTYAGFAIQRMTNGTQLAATSNAAATAAAAALQSPPPVFTLSSEYSKYFTVLENGMLMTTSDLTPLVNRQVNLVVVEETHNATARHQLQLFVMDRKDMLQFPGASLEAFGEVAENQAPGTKVQGVPLLQANSASGNKPITYSITGGNEDAAFTLQNSVTKEVAERMTIKHAEQSGIWLITAQPLDREARNNYTLFIQATDDEGLDKATSKIQIRILDENDNRPVFNSRDYKFTVAGRKGTNGDGNATTVWNRFTSIGHVSARDADGDKVTYKLLTPNNVVIIVPQTGELLLAGEPEKSELMLKVEAHDLRTPSLKSARAADVLIEFIAPDPTAVVMQHLLLQHEGAYAQHSHRRDKRRVTRAVRPTKRMEFTENDGDVEGKNVFHLEKETDRETFKIRDENGWVTVEPNGAVRVKKKWDYEELGPEKTIDFWVIISNSGQSGEFRLCIFVLTCLFCFYFIRCFWLLYVFRYFWLCFVLGNVVKGISVGIVGEKFASLSPYCVQRARLFQ